MNTAKSTIQIMATTPKKIIAKLKRLQPIPEYGWWWDDDQWLLLLRDPAKDTIDPDGYVAVLPDENAGFGVVFLLTFESGSCFEFNDTISKERDRSRIIKALATAGAGGLITEEIETTLGIPYRTCAARILELGPLFMLGPVIRANLEEAKRFIDELLAVDTPDIP
jgi:hypothetical protein